MGPELKADPRTVAAAYRELATEGVVELRSRSGVYISPQTMVNAGANGTLCWGERYS